MSEVALARMFIAICLVLAMLAVSNPSLFATGPPTDSPSVINEVTIE